MLLDARLDNRERFRQMVLEEKAGFEARLVPAAAMALSTRGSARHSTRPPGPTSRSGGVSYLFFLRELVEAASTATGLASRGRAVAHLRDLLLNRAAWWSMSPPMRRLWDGVRSRSSSVSSPVCRSRTIAGARLAASASAAQSEGLTFPGQVNYVGQGRRPLRARAIKPQRRGVGDAEVI